MLDLSRRSAEAAVVAVAFNAIVRTVVRSWQHVPDAFDPFTWPPIIVATCVGVVGGALCYLGLRGFRGERSGTVWFTWFGYAVMVLSFITPVTLLWQTPPQYPGTTIVTVSSLELMHLSTAVATIEFLTGRWTLFARRGAVTP